MAKWDRIGIKRKIPVEELDKRIKSLELDVKVLDRLHFIRNRYLEDSVELAASKSGVTKRVGYIWQERWNKEGYEGLKPKYGGGRPAQITNEQKSELKEILTERDDWTTKKVRKLIKDKFDVEFSEKHVRTILRNLGLKFARPYPKDYRRPPDAEKQLKKNIDQALTKKPDIIGFFDEFSPQSTANTQKLWSITKPVVTKNTTHLRANTFGVYAIKGQNTIDFKENSKKEDITECINQIRTLNPYGRLLIILDNFRSHHAKLTTETAKNLNIDLVFIPPYSPHLNPIEYVWKTIKRELSPLFIETQEQLKKLIETHFKNQSQSLKFLNKKYKKISI